MATNDVTHTTGAHVSGGARIQGATGVSVAADEDTPTIVASYRDTVDGEIEKMRAKRGAAVPMGHMGDAWDIAHAAAFLASDQARYITGAELVVDGGLTRSIGFQV